MTSSDQPADKTAAQLSPESVQAIILKLEADKHWLLEQRDAWETSANSKGEQVLALTAEKDGLQVRCEDAARRIIELERAADLYRADLIRAQNTFCGRIARMLGLQRRVY